MRMDQAQVARAPKGSRVQQLHRLIRLAIEQGRFVPCQRLMEADLTRDFGVSRGPVREALRLLAMEGTIEIVPNRGAVVRRLSHREVLDILAVRIAVEGLAAQLAAYNIGVGDNRARLQRFAARLAPSAASSLNDFLEENLQLHRMLVEFADNAQLSAVIEQMRLPLFPRLSANTGADEAYRQASSKEHVAVVRAVLSGDTTKARTAMETHLKNVRKRLIEILGIAPPRT